MYEAKSKQEKEKTWLVYTSVCLVFGMVFLVLNINNNLDSPGLHHDLYQEP